MTLPSKPSIVRRARLRWDAARGSNVLLVPEGVVTLTPEAAEVLALCDGTREIDALVTVLAERYPDTDRETLHTDTVDLLARLVDRGYVTDAP